MHTMIVGQTMSGKTFLAQELCRQARRRGMMTMVLDPRLDPAWGRSSGKHWLTSDVDLFVQRVFHPRVRDAAIFIDECGQTVGLHPSAEMEKVVTMGRHHGHRVFLIGQRGVQVNRTMRDQTKSLYLFNVGVDDAQEWRRSYNDDLLLRAPSLPQWHYIHKVRMKPAKIYGPILRS